MAGAENMTYFFVVGMVFFFVAVLFDDVLFALNGLALIIYDGLMAIKEKMK